MVECENDSWHPGRFPELVEYQWFAFPLPGLRLLVDSWRLASDVEHLTAVLTPPTLSPCRCRWPRFRSAIVMRKHWLKLRILMPRLARTIRLGTKPLGVITTHPRKFSCNKLPRALKALFRRRCRFRPDTSD